MDGFVTQRASLSVRRRTHLCILAGIIIAGGTVITTPCSHLLTVRFGAVMPRASSLPLLVLLATPALFTVGLLPMFALGLPLPLPSFFILSLASTPRGFSRLDSPCHYLLIACPAPAPLCGRHGEIRGFSGFSVSRVGWRQAGETIQGLGREGTASVSVCFNPT